ncbi:MAG: hypothetical protein FJX42_08575 [Alphaproteobacteria bacterium]|nr:hypothetical protein [Alphaproteobacteria bacterium]
MLHRFGKRARFVLASVAVLFWALAGAAPFAHAATPKSAFEPVQHSVQGSAHDHGAVAADDQSDGQHGQNDRCCPPGCSFSAVASVFTGIVLGPVATAAGARGYDVAPGNAAAPPLRPPRA